MTQTAQHTQGEWKAYNTADIPENRFKVGVYNEYAGAFQCIANCSYETTQGASGQEALANARLIAAAPKLLAACEEMLKLFNFEPYLETEFEDGECPMFDRAKSAIAAATAK